MCLAQHASWQGVLVWQGHGREQGPAACCSTSSSLGIALVKLQDAQMQRLHHALPMSMLKDTARQGRETDVPRLASTAWVKRDLIRL